MFLAGGAQATAPRLYHQPGYESPLRGDPDDLLLLAGDGFSVDDVVVYQAIADTTKPAARPRSAPSQSTPETGIAPVVSRAGVPRFLTIKLPPDARRDQSYALWVRTARGEWSAPVVINDARPLWFTPSFIYASATLGSLPRELKVVGRNLQPAPGVVTKIQLVGPETITDTVIVDAQASESLDRYAARLRLPP